MSDTPTTKGHPLFSMLRTLEKTLGIDWTANRGKMRPGSPGENLQTYAVLLLASEVRGLREAVDKHGSALVEKLGERP